MEKVRGNYNYYESQNNEVAYPSESVDGRGEKTDATEQEVLKRRENDILAALLYGKYEEKRDKNGTLININRLIAPNPYAINRREDVSPKQKALILSFIRKGIIQSSDVSTFINENVAASWQKHGGFEGVLPFIGEGFEKGVFRYMIYGDLNGEKPLRKEDSEMFYNQYPTPERFEEKSANLLTHVKKTSYGDRYYEEYVNATNKLEEVIYGEQLEYWKAFKRLEKEANEPKDQ